MNPNALKEWVANHPEIDIDEGNDVIAFAEIWEDEVHTLTNERDLARRANEQNIKIIKNLRKQLRKGDRQMTPTPEEVLAECLGCGTRPISSMG